MKKILIAFFVLTGLLVGSGVLFAQAGQKRKGIETRTVPQGSFTIHCGNGTLETRLGEQCDDGNRTSGDGCSSECRRETNCQSGYEVGSTGICVPTTTVPPRPPSSVLCGNGRIDGDEECDGTARRGGIPPRFTCDSNCKAHYCGDGTVDAGEQCDDGNTLNGDGCDRVCQNEPRCGDGRMNPPEQCDDGNTTDGDGCSSTCQNEPRCGNGVVETGEECDDGNAVDGDECDSVCHREHHACNDECWTKVISGPGDSHDIVFGIAVDSSSNVVAVGQYVTAYENGQSADIWFAKYDRCGNELWARTYSGTPQHEWGEDVAIDGDGNIYIVGNVQVPGALETDSNIVIVKLDGLTGIPIWSATYDGENSSSASLDKGFGVALDSSGLVYITGYETKSAETVETGFFSRVVTRTNLLLAKYNPTDGTLVWARSFDSGDSAFPNRHGYDIFIRSDIIYITGTTQLEGNGYSALHASGGAGHKLFVSAHDVINGDELWISNYPSSENRSYLAGYGINFNESLGLLEVTGVLENLVPPLYAPSLWFGKFNPTDGSFMDESLFTTTGSSDFGSVGFDIVTHGDDSYIVGYENQAGNAATGAVPDTDILFLNPEIPSSAQTVAGDPDANRDVGYAIAVDPEGHLIVGGEISSPDLPAPPNTELDGDIWIKKYPLNPNNACLTN